MAVREMFAKSALYWHRTYGIHVAGIVIYPGDEESGRQASGFFAGSDIVKALIDAQRVDAKHMIDEITTILKLRKQEARILESMQGGDGGNESNSADEVDGESDDNGDNGEDE
ncbi:hypothetical protein P692DRAFT_201808422 [Suillus brevipes Sb2]|nr:hypothetical protein P692DRAFT_201808422 [Suillus brevipes Sb2]